MNTQSRIEWKEVIVLSIVSLDFFTVVTGLLNPAAIRGIAQAIFPYPVNDSLLIDYAGNVVSSELIGQKFSNPAYFWGRFSTN